jgi:hypothetical protein
MDSIQARICAGRMRPEHGRYFMRTRVMIILPSTFYRTIRKLFVLGGTAMLWGWVKQEIQRTAKYKNPTIRYVVKQYPVSGILLGKEEMLQSIEWSH